MGTQERTPEENLQEVGRNYGGLGEASGLKTKDPFSLNSPSIF